MFVSDRTMGCPFPETVLTLFHSISERFVQDWSVYFNCVEELNDT